MRESGTAQKAFVARAASACSVRTTACRVLLLPPLVWNALIDVLARFDCPPLVSLTISALDSKEVITTDRTGQPLPLSATGLTEPRPLLALSARTLPDPATATRFITGTRESGRMT